MQLSTIRYFCEVARSGSIREAADRLHIATSAISRQIAQLEGEFGEPLFERHARGITLTSAGAIVQEHFHEMLLRVDLISDHLSELKGLRRGRVRIATVEGAVAYLLAQAIADFHSTYPGITLEVTVASASEIVNTVLKDEADLFIAFNAPPHADISIVAQIAEPLYVVVSPEHELWAAESCTLRQIAHMPFGYMAEAHGIRRLLDQAFHRVGVVPQPALVSNSIEALKAFARRAGGVTFMPRFAAQREIEAGELGLVPVLEVDLMTADLVIGVHRGRRISHATREITERIKNLLMDLPKPTARRDNTLPATS